LIQVMFYMSNHSNAACDFVCILCQVHEHVDDASVSIRGRVKKYPSSTRLTTETTAGPCAVELGRMMATDLSSRPRKAVGSGMIRFVWNSSAAPEAPVLEVAAPASVPTLQLQGRNLEAISEDKRGFVAETEGAGL
jgi:hypothetical protein